MMETARWLIAFVSAGTAIGALCMDYLMATGRQHIRNPRWPPHAKFHNGQTIVMGIVQGAIALVLLFEPGQLTAGRLLLAAIISSIYWLGLFGARLFPGTAWTDPEFEAETTKPLGFHLQQLLGLALLSILGAAIALAFLSGHPLEERP
jgi:hypothetical protein